MFDSFVSSIHGCSGRSYLSNTERCRLFPSCCLNAPRLEKKSKSTTVARNGRLLGHKNADIDRIMSVALRQQSSDFISEAHSARTAGCDSGGV